MADTHIHTDKHTHRQTQTYTCYRQNQDEGTLLVLKKSSFYSMSFLYVQENDINYYGGNN